MSYTPTTWTNGDTITAEKLNKIENGIANSAPSFNVYTFTQQSDQDQYVRTTTEDTAKILDDISNHRPFMINVKLYGANSPSNPRLVIGYGPYVNYDNTIALETQNGAMSPSGMTGIPYYDGTYQIFRWDLFID